MACGRAAQTSRTGCHPGRGCSGTSPRASGHSGKRRKDQGAPRAAAHTAGAGPAPSPQDQPGERRTPRVLFLGRTVTSDFCRVFTTSGHGCPRQTLRTAHARPQSPARAPFLFKRSEIPNPQQEVTCRSPGGKGRGGAERAGGSTTWAQQGPGLWVPSTRRATRKTRYGIGTDRMDEPGPPRQVPASAAGAKTRRRREPASQRRAYAFQAGIAAAPRPRKASCPANALPLRAAGGRRGSPLWQRGRGRGARSFRRRVGPHGYGRRGTENLRPGPGARVTRLSIARVLHALTCVITSAVTLQTGEAGGRRAPRAGRGGWGAPPAALGGTGPLLAAMVLTSGDWETLDEGERGLGHDFEVSVRNCPWRETPAFGPFSMLPAPSRRGFPSVSTDSETSARTSSRTELTEGPRSARSPGA